MKTLLVKLWREAYYSSKIQVPDDLTLDEAIEYAKKHIDDIPTGNLEYLPSDGELVEDFCEFYEED